MVPADSNLRRIENILFLEDIREIPTSDPPQEPPSALNTVLDPTTLEGKSGDEEVQPPLKDTSPEDSLTIKDVVVQSKEAGPKPTARDNHPAAEDPTKA